MRGPRASLNHTFLSDNLWGRIQEISFNKTATHIAPHPQPLSPGYRGEGRFFHLWGEAAGRMRMPLVERSNAVQPTTD